MEKDRKKTNQEHRSTLAIRGKSESRAAEGNEGQVRERGNLPDLLKAKVGLGKRKKGTWNGGGNAIECGGMIKKKFGNGGARGEIS